jgi:hypothetical protein
MKTFQELKQAAEAILVICNKEQHSKPDKTRLLKLHDEILTAIESLKECDGCSRIDAIATITIDDVTAQLCKECGVKALKAEKIKKRRRSTRKSAKPTLARSKRTENSGRVEPMAQEGNPIASVSGVGPLFEEELQAINIHTDIELIRRVELDGAPVILEEIKQNKPEARLSLQRILAIYENAKANSSTTPENVKTSVE